MKKMIIAILLAAMPAMAFSAAGSMPLDSAPVDHSDKQSLQRGGKLFVDYCMSCHSAKFMRYSRMGKDLEIAPDTLASDYMITTDKPGDTMQVALTDVQAAKWFGTKIPDLSVISRSRGADWLYTYLRNFYADDSRPFGVNNRLFKDVAMPHVLEDLQGLKQAVYTTDEYGQKHIERLEPMTSGSVSNAQFDQKVGDLVNFLDYVGDPVKVERQRLGFKVLLFLVVFFGLAYALKREYWRDVH